MTGAPGDAPAGFPQQLRVEPEFDGARLDVYLAGRPEVGSRPNAKALVQAGRVRVEGRPCKPGQVVRHGQRVEFDPDLPAVTPVVAEPGCAPAILFADASLIVIDKPAGLVSHPPRTGSREAFSVASWAAGIRGGLPRCGGEDRPGIVHRLDKETSGVMVIACTEASFAALKEQFRARQVDKEYRAIAFGESRFDSDFIDRNIGTHPTKGDRMVVTREGGREARTYYEVVERFRGFTHFACRPQTGRTHQIRVHMTSVGHGLVGDRFYRSRNHANSVLPEGAPDPGRHCLHARSLGFTHPSTGERMTFEAELPADLTALLAWLREHRSPDF